MHVVRSHRPVTPSLSLQHSYSRHAAVWVMLICSFCLFTHRAVRFLLRKPLRERKLSKGCILLTSHILNGTVQHKIQKRVKSFQDTTCCWRPHRKQWLGPKQGIQQHKTAWKVHSVLQPVPSFRQDQANEIRDTKQCPLYQWQVHKSWSTLCQLKDFSINSTKCSSRHWHFCFQPISRAF